jgi:uncharacterized protein with GYD domain
VGIRQDTFLTVPSHKRDLKTSKVSLRLSNRQKLTCRKWGVKTVGVWFTFGRSDIVAVFDAPDDYAAAVVALNASARGNWTIETVRALSEDEFAQVVQRLP